MFQRSLFVLVAITTAFLVAACGGGDDDRDAVPAGAKVCELRYSQEPQFLNYQAYGIRQIEDKVFLPPILVSEPGDVLRVQYPFAPGIIYEIPGASYVFTMQQFSYHNPGPVWQCVVEGLALGDRIVFRGGPSDRKIEWYLAIYATITLADGRRALSLPETYIIER